MNTDPTSVAAVVRMLSDDDLVRLVNIATPAAAAAAIRLIPDADLVRLVDVAKDADRPAAEPAAPPPRRPANRTARRTPTAPAEDVSIIVACVRELAPRGLVTRRAINEASSDPTWIENGWGPERVAAALATALEQGAIRMEGKNKGAHYVLTSNAPAAPAEASDEGAPVEAVIQ